MALNGELVIKNHEGTQLEGPRENGSCLVRKASFGVTLPVGYEGKIQGSRQISGLTISKDIDRLSPQLFEIICLGRTCKEVTLTLFTIDDQGDEKPFFVYRLEEAKIFNISQTMDGEGLAFIAKTYTMEFLEGGIIYTETAF
jgi:type VI secretion system secreted protein Hcp